ncbi:MAG: nuclear transport factor 2 family protein [Chitinophagaceae bacterium]|nr:nuclear transport factor 2 family protein [Chitinophagaceae bacterium]
MKLKLFFAFALIFSAVTGYSQITEQELKDLIIQKDSLFWVAYNNCDIEAMTSVITEDVEFYHDKGGITKTRDALIKTVKQNLCSNPNFRLRREAVPGTVQVYPMTQNDKIYGAIISGEHVFYINEAGKKEFLDGQAHFVQLWLLKEGVWAMARILSYNHHPAEKNAALKEVPVSSDALLRLTGKYKGPEHLMEVKNENGKLKLVVEDKEYLLKAASDTEYFMTERDLKFVFQNNKLIVKEHDQVVEEAIKQ